MPNLTLAKVEPDARRDVDYRALDQRLQQLIDKPSMVGLAVGVVENGRITFLKGYGETEAGSGEPVTPATVFRWASVSKGVASTMVAKLAEEGKVDLEAPVVNYAPGLKLPGALRISRQRRRPAVAPLGLYRNAYDNKLEEGGDPAMLRRGLAALNPICPPRTCWSYQNVAYDASSEIVERVTGKTFADVGQGPAVRRRSAWPARACRCPSCSRATAGRGRTARGKKVLPMIDTYYKVPAAGGVNSNIKDMSLWMLAQMGAMPGVLDQRLLDTIHAPLGRRLRASAGGCATFSSGSSTAWYGYGWRSYDYAGHRIVGHRGGINGYRSLILFDPAKKSGVVALWNSNTLAARRPRVRGDGHALPAAVPRLDEARRRCRRSQAGFRDRRRAAPSAARRPSCRGRCRRPYDIIDERECRRTGPAARSDR